MVCLPILQQGRERFGRVRRFGHVITDGARLIRGVDAVAIRACTNLAALERDPESLFHLARLRRVVVEEEPSSPSRIDPGGAPAVITFSAIVVWSGVATTVQRRAK